MTHFGAEMETLRFPYQKQETIIGETIGGMHMKKKGSISIFTDWSTGSFRMQQDK